MDSTKANQRFRDSSRGCQTYPKAFGLGSTKPSGIQTQPSWIRLLITGAAAMKSRDADTEK